MIALGSRQLVLASGSPYRRQLLSRLGVGVLQDSPELDESPLPGEAPEAIAERLAAAKAAAVTAHHPDALVVGSDQVAARGEVIMGKPGDLDRARNQLSGCSGQWVDFHTGLCVIDARTGDSRQGVERFSVKFRELSEEQIERYLLREQPFDCAGSFKAESLGIALFERWRGRDANALIGLPLMLLVDYLTALGIDVI